MNDTNLASPNFKADPFPYFEWLREEAPITRAKLPDGRKAWLVTRHADGLAVLADQRFRKDAAAARAKTGAAPQWLPGSLRALSRNMLDVDEPDHRRLRNLVQKAFTPAVVEQLRPRIETLADHLIEQMANKDRLDLIRDYAAPIPVTVIADLLGIPSDVRLRFRRWSEHVVAADASAWHKLRALPAAFALVRFLKSLVRERQRNGGDDLASRLIHAHEEGDQLSADEVVAMAFLLLVAGHETTVNLIGNGLLTLLRHPEAMEQLRTQPDLIGGAVEELLRYSGPLQVATERYAADDLDFRGTLIRKGSLVLVVLASANRDAAAFEHANEFVPTRSPNRHLAFGYGIHYCLGAPLARLEAEIAFRRFIARYPPGTLHLSPKQLQWRPGLTIRGVKSLPVQVSGSLASLPTEAAK